MGEGLGLSQLHLGVHAASLQDMWTVASEIAERAGGDPGFPAFMDLKPSEQKRSQNASLFLRLKVGQNAMIPRVLHLHAI